MINEVVYFRRENKDLSHVQLRMRTLSCCESDGNLPHEALLGFLSPDHLGGNTAHFERDGPPILHQKLRGAHPDVFDLAGHRGRARVPTHLPAVEGLDGWLFFIGGGIEKIPPRHHLLDGVHRSFAENLAALAICLCHT